MGVLALKEAYFLDTDDHEGLEVTIEAQQSFLKAHLGRWAPFFCERLNEASDSSFYGALASATAAVVMAEVTELQVEPIPLFTGPVLPPQPLEEEMTCPMA
ncbi:chaperone protein TorD [compost metagenome]